jgi:hypothetical protein
VQSLVRINHGSRDQSRQANISPLLRSWGEVVAGSGFHGTAYFTYRGRWPQRGKDDRSLNFLQKRKEVTDKNSIRNASRERETHIGWRRPHRGIVNMKIKLLLALCTLSFAVAALRFAPGRPLSDNVTDFAGGLGLGIAIALVVTWLDQRTPPK